MGFWSSIWKTRTKDWLFVPLDPRQVPSGHPRTAVPPDTGYLHVFLRSMRITHVRRGLSKFYGIVHSYMSVPHLLGEVAEFQVVTTPDRFKNVEAKNLDVVVVTNRRLLGPVPYRGGDVEVELGLFSIKSTDLAGPFIELMEGISSVAGVTFVSAALPFAQPLKNGINLLTGGDSPAILEIGVSTTFAQPQTGYFVVVRAERADLDPAELRVSDDFKLVRANGSQVASYPYLVFEVEASAKRDDWFQIPDLSKQYGALREEVQKGDVEAANEAFAVFKRTVLTSPDLITSDAERLAKKVAAEVQAVLTTALTSKTTADLPKLKDVGLYDD